LNICSICYNIHIHSKVKQWDGNKWIKRRLNLDNWLKPNVKL
jgi:hypothetical protein